MPKKTVAQTTGLYFALASKMENRYKNLPQTIEKKKVQVGKDQEKAQSERDSHSKNRGGKKTN